jgi:hypothetical protein
MGLRHVRRMTRVNRENVLKFSPQCRQRLRFLQHLAKEKKSSLRKHFVKAWTPTRLALWDLPGGSLPNFLRALICEGSHEAPHAGIRTNIKNVYDLHARKFDHCSFFGAQAIPLEAVRTSMWRAATTLRPARQPCFVTSTL